MERAKKKRENQALHQLLFSQPSDPYSGQQARGKDSIAQIEAMMEQELPFLKEEAKEKPEQRASVESICQALRELGINPPAENYFNDSPESFKTQAAIEDLLQKYHKQKILKKRARQNEEALKRKVAELETQNVELKHIQKTTKLELNECKKQLDVLKDKFEKKSSTTNVLGHEVNKETMRLEHKLHVMRVEMQKQQALNKQLKDKLSDILIADQASICNSQIEISRSLEGKRVEGFADPGVFSKHLFENQEKLLVSHYQESQSLKETLSEVGHKMQMLASEVVGVQFAGLNKGFRFGDSAVQVVRESQKFYEAINAYMGVKKKVFDILKEEGIHTEHELKKRLVGGQQTKSDMPKPQPRQVEEAIVNREAEELEENPIMQERQKWAMALNIGNSESTILFDSDTE